eukprot:TRINITY_DN2785_c0_g1_i2.p1 TRINITY_DN2785_c0_g1~~TRINITY_DN2785_c0_g1_i2.p1  ORF type:complete len:167 (+),score=32.60 TRINITY_DN2785_c0_g1_i2:286-786(+)
MPQTLYSREEKTGKNGKDRKKKMELPHPKSLGSFVFKEKYCIFCKKKEEYPEIYKDLEGIQVPEGCSKLAGVFPGFAINESVSTKCHRDFGDYPDGLCAVISFGEFTGGDLCFLEPQMIFPFPAGQIIFFRSVLLNHWNLDFVGQRHSLVFFTCNNLYKWNKKSES